MKIASSDLQWQTQHHSMQTQSQSTRLRVWARSGSGVPPAPQAARTAPAAPHHTHAAQRHGRVRDADDNDKNISPQLALLRDLIARMTGIQPQSVHLPDAGTGDAAAAPSASPPATPAPAPSPGPNVGLVYEQRSMREEAELTRWSAEGVVRTTDGQEIHFSVQLQMQRYWREESSTTIGMGAAAAPATDPLVINFDGSAAELQNLRFDFDLDGDGQTEQVPLLAGNRGYLALDSNQNQHVDNGLELFGPASGNGYAELATHDDDHNGWIDEGDAIYHQLGVWTPTADGTGQLRTLQQAGVGALSLSAGATPFALRTSSNQALGTVQATSAYLGDDGSVGTMQQIDLTA